MDELALFKMGLEFIGQHPEVLSNVPALVALGLIGYLVRNFKKSGAVELQFLKDHVQACEEKYIDLKSRYHDLEAQYAKLSDDLKDTRDRILAELLTIARRAAP